MQLCQPEFLCTRYIVKGEQNKTMRISCYINITKKERQKAVLFFARKKSDLREKLQEILVSLYKFGDKNIIF